MASQINYTLYYDTDNCRFEYFKTVVDTSVTTQLLDLPLSKTTQVIDLGTEQVFVKFDHTTQTFTYGSNLKAYNRSTGGGDVLQTHNTFNDFLDWVKAARNTCS